MLIKTINQSNLAWPILLMLALFMLGCAHQTKVKPSKGHIDAQTQAPESTVKKLTPLEMVIPKSTKNIPYLSPPQAKVKPQTYSVVVNEVPVKEILFALARESKMNIDIHPSIHGVVTINAVDQTLAAILDRLSRQVDLTYKMDGDTVSIRPDSPYLKTYIVNYVNMNRDTTGEISVSNQIASNASMTGDAKKLDRADAGDNTSKTKVESKSAHHLWDSLIQNIKDILIESDKDVLVNRLGTDSRLQGLYDAKSSGTGYASMGGQGPVYGGLATGNSNQNIVANVEESAEKNLKNYKTLFAASVIPNKETGVLSIRATQRQHSKVQEFLDKVIASASRQVLIEATIVEIKLNDKYQAGVDWSRLGSSGKLDGFTFQQNLLGTTLATGPSMVIGYAKAGTVIGDLAASVKLLQSFGATKVLSSPKLMVLNSQTAILKSVDNLVYFTVESNTILATATTAAYTTFTTTPHTMPVGVWMSVTPQVNENGTVTINVRPTISRQSGAVQDPNPLLKIISYIPQITVREMESMLQVPTGNTVILGGLMQDELLNNSNGIPGISKLPIIGNVFKAQDENITKTELVIFLRPTVIPNPTLDSEELQAYKQYLPSQQLQNTFDEFSN